MESVNFVGAKLVKMYLKYPQLISAVTRALEEYSTCPAAQPLRTSLPVGDRNGTFLTMPSYSKSDDVLVAKLVGLYPDNSKKNLPTHHCYITVLDPDTGILNCLMDGEVVTAMRTAAASVVATQAVMKDSPKTLGVLGSGVQARSHISAFCATFDIQKITIWSRNFTNAQKLCKEMSDLPLEACHTVQEAVQDANVIITATHATEPVLFGKWLKPGCHINCVGACKPNWRECDDDCMKNSIVYVDSKESAESESGDIIDSKAEIYAEIGEILLKKKEVKRGQLTLFKSLGFGLEDAVAAKLVWEGVKKGEKLD